MSFRPVQGYFGNLEYLNQQAEQSAQDALLAQQQAAAFAQQQQEETAAYKAQLDDMLAQNQAMYDEALRQQEAQGAQMQSGGMTAGAPNFGMPAEAKPEYTTGNKWADAFLQQADGFKFGQHGFNAITTGAKATPNDVVGATVWNKKVLDAWLDDQATRNGWNSTQKLGVRKQVEESLAKHTGNAHIFNAEDRGLIGAAGDFANRVADGAIGGLAEVGAVAAIYADKGLAATARKYGMGNLWADDQTTTRGWLQSVQNARDWWGGFRSNESKDAELARATAQGMMEQWDVIKDNPTALTDELGNMIGMLAGV